MAFVLPFMLIGLTLYALLGGLLGLLISFIMPPLAFILTFLLLASSSVIPTLIGTRMGLQAKGVKPRTKIWGLVLPAVIYGAVEGVSITVIIGVMAAVSVAVISPDTLLQTQAGNIVSQYLENTLFIPSLVGLAAVFLSICSIRASLLVPITSASIGRDPDGLPYTPFRHFRASFGPIFTLTILSYVGMIIMHTVLIVVIIQTGTAQTLQADLEQFAGMTRGFLPIQVIWSLVLLFIIYSLIGTWAFSLQCAGGVLGFLKLREEFGDSPHFELSQTGGQPTPSVPASGPRLSSEELRALRKSREADNH